MRSLLIIILLSGIVLVGASSCATMSKAPLASGEVRLFKYGCFGNWPRSEHILCG